MDNLELFCSYELKTNKDGLCGNIAACSHVNSTAICFICGNNTLCVQNGIEGNKKVFKISEVKEDLKYIQHMPINNYIFLASQIELAIFDLATGRIKDIHVHEKEVVDLAWDPIQSSLVLIDADFTIWMYTYSTSIMETSSFIITFQTELTSKVPEAVLVGWGSHNTQFKGPKQNKNCIEVPKDESIIFDGPPKISWRGNGEQFVINFFVDGFRRIKVFDNQLNALFESDIHYNLSEPVSFMGQGQYIASCVLHNDINNLIIFEKNCKVKSIYGLKETQGFITKMLFHPEMNILGILCKEYKKNDVIDIYTYSNACWFLKQRLHYASSVKVHDFFWIQPNTYQLCKMVVFTSENVEYHTLRFVTSKGESNAVVGIINGKLLNIHLFENTIVPPPMQSFSYEHIRPINRVIFHPQKPICLLVDSQMNMSLLSIEKSYAKVISSVQFNEEQKITYLQIDWDMNDNVNVYLRCSDRICPTHKKLGDKLNVIPMEQNITSTNTLKLEYSKQDNLLDDSEVMLYGATFNSESNGLILNFDIVLNACRELLINGKVIHSGVTSALLFKKYLLWITSTGLLYCIRDKQFNKTFDLSNIFVRHIEHGAKIVCCNNMTPPQIILQLPRGNLEIIRCKMISVDIIDKMLSNNNWEVVLQIMRIEKLNWNILIDLNPQRFYDNIQCFVKAATFSNLLTAIVNDFDLKANCFQTVYKNYLDELPVSKISKKTIVERIINLLSSMNCVINLNCIVALKQKHSSLKSALISVKQVYSLNSVDYELVCSKAITLLLQQAHLNDILKEAFVLYDLPLLALIYRNSNEDPKVYGPELTNLYNMSELERRFQLCLRAYNPSAAVKYLLVMDQFDEEYVVSFIVKNKLEPAAYESISNYNNHESHQFKLVSKLYANRLAAEGKYSEAGMLLKRSKLIEESLQQYQKALEWREVIILMDMLNYSEKQKNIILESLASELLRVNNFENAVIIYEHHMKDYKKAINCLVECKNYQRAVNLAKMYNELEILNNTVIPSLLDYCHTLMNKVESQHNKFHLFVNRLEKVRGELRKKIDIGDHICFYQNRDIELFSDTSSVSSGRLSKKTSSSRNSTLSSKNRRKEERKKIDLREGGFYEDIALMRALHMMYDEVYLLAKEVRNVCIIEELDDSKFCKNIHEKLGNLQTQMKENLKDIWPEVFYKTPVMKDSLVESIIRNKNDLDPKYTIPPSDELLTDNWKLRMFS